MSTLKNNYLKIFLIIPVMLAAVQGCSDDKDENTGVTPPEVENNILSLDRQSLLFNAEDESRMEVKVSKTADIYDATCPAEWVNIGLTNESFFVSVEPYTEQQAAAAGFEAREAVITVVAGTAEPETVTITQNSPLEQRLYIRTEPSRIYFGVGETTAVVEIFTNIPNVTYSVPSQYGWLADVDMTGNVIAVTVPQYIGEEEREGYITLSSPDTDLHYKLWVEQENEIVLDLEGVWKWTGQNWDGSSYTADNGTVELIYDPRYDFYLAEPFEANLTGMDTPAGGMAFRVNEKNQVTFTHTDKLHMYKESDFWGIMQFWYSYRNTVLYADSDGDRASEDVEPWKVFILPATSETITFPANATVNGTQYDLLFGHGGYSYDPDTEEEEENGRPEPFGVWRNLVFTKAN